MKKLITVLMTVLMVSCLFGCEKKDNEPEAIKIGLSGPLTGPAALYGQAVENAAKLAVEEINALGGLQFELKMEDDQHDAEKADNAYNALIDWGMQVSLGTVTSGPGQAVSAKYRDDNIFALTPSASSTAVILENINDPDSYYGNIFQMCFIDPNQGIASADYIADNKLAEKIAIIYKNDESYSIGIYEKFVAEAATKGLNVVYTGTFNDSNANDFNVQLTQAQQAGADLVFLPIYYTPASLIFAQAKNMGYSPIFFGVDGMDGILTMPGFDTALAEGVYLLTPFSADSTDDATVKFVANYKAKYDNEVPIQFAADAYDCVYAIYEACKAGNVTYEMSASEICDIMVKQFTTMTFVGTTGESTWAKSGEVSKSPKAVIIENGVYVSAK